MTRSTATTPGVLALLLLTACGAGDDGGSLEGDVVNTVVAEAAADGTQTVTVDSADGPNRFVPERVQVAATGDVTLTLTNSGGAPHDLVAEDVPGLRTETVGGGEEQTVTFSPPPPGTYTFVCTIHPGMDGELVVP